ncbi:MAG: hypothetical protein KDA41_13375 [Planctomycetales bacterium]|nr:hypothetical protein [Planctomycetales bacterium]
MRRRGKGNGMSVDIQRLVVYLHLARASELRRRPLVRDRLLVIAAALAQVAGLSRIAALCRCKVLQSNPGHMLRRWEQMAEAVENEDFGGLLKQLIRRFPPEKAEQMLQSLNVEWKGQRAAYFNDEEYAASIWGLTAEQLARDYPLADDAAG